AGAQGRAKPNYYAWLPLGGVVLASLFVAVLWLVQPAVSPMPELDSAADFELLSGHEDLDFYQELEFYYWLDEEDRHAD
ncbi:MAG: hypothetical protein WCX90_08235, partial [Thiohalomonadaceae bacterium]